jgi:hypothetical protein
MGTVQPKHHNYYSVIEKDIQQIYGSLIDNSLPFIAKNTLHGPAQRKLLMTKP